jgi:hypothetical protein
MRIISGLDFLPQSKDTLLVDPKSLIRNLELMNRVLEHSIEALNYFLNNEFHKFDAQVGETLCQIRAYKLYLLANFKYKTNRNEIKENAINIMDKKILICKKIKKLKDEKNKSRYNQNISLYELFQNNELYFEISEDLYFIISCYILSKYNSLNEEGIPIAINQPKVMMGFDISRSLAKRFINNLQKNISSISCDFIIKITGELKELSMEHKKILPLLKFTADEGRKALPCFEVTNVIVQHMRENDGEFVFLIHNANKKLINFPIFFKFINKEIEINNYSFINDNKKIYVVFKGVTNHDINKSIKLFTDKLISKGLDTIILANSATHPQYSGKNLYHLREDPFANISANNDIESIQKIEYLREKLHRYVKYSHEYGCEVNNSNLLFIQHIFCDSYQHIKEVCCEFNPPLFRENRKILELSVD